MVKTSIERGTGSIPGQGTKTPHAAWCGQKSIKGKKGVLVKQAANIHTRGCSTVFKGGDGAAGAKWSYSQDLLNGKG